MDTVEGELDETMFWLEFTVGLPEEHRLKVAPLWKEGDELTAIIVSSIITAKAIIKKIRFPISKTLAKKEFGFELLRNSES